MSGIRTILTMSAAVLLVAGCGGGGDESASSSPAAVASTPSAAETTHSATPGEPSLIAVPGYAYESAMPAMEQQFATLADGKILTSMSAHAVTQDRAPVGTLVLFDVGQKFAANDAFTESIVNGMAGGMSGSGGKVEQQTISGEKVAVATVDESGQTGVVYAWYHDGTMSMFMAVDAQTAAAPAFVQAYLEVANA